MTSILEHLFMCAMEDQKRYLDGPELRDYRAASRAQSELKEKLEQLLDGEALRLFKLYTENRNEESNFDEYSSFRKGLSMGLKLGAFYSSEY